MTHENSEASEALARGRVAASVIVPLGVFSADALLQLEALSAQTFQGFFEILLVANFRPAESEVTALRRYLRAQDRLIVADERRGPGFARNQGASCSRAPYLGFCDADDIVSPTWLAEHLACLRHADISLGSLEFSRLNSLTAQCWARGLPRVPGLLRNFLISGPSANVAVRRAVFQHLNGFDETFTAGEDVDFCWRAQLGGFRIAVAPAAVVHYRLRSSLAGLVRQSFGYARWEVALYARYRAAGMKRIALRVLVRDYAWLVKNSGRALLSQEARGLWLGALAVRLGRLWGSWERHVWYP